MTYSFTRTREQMRDIIARKLGVLESGQALPAEENAIILEGIDLTLKTLHARNIIWAGVSGAQTSIAITANVATATIAATDYLFPLSLMLTVGTEQQPIEIIGHRAYQAITDKATTGEPEQALIVGTTIRLYPVPSTNGSLKLTYVPTAEDSATGQALDVPVEMMQPLAIVVAASLVDDFDVEPERAARLFAQADPSMRVLRELSAQRVDATTVTPDWY